MYDAVTAENIPTSAVMVAGYIDKIKLEPWSAGDWARFPNAAKVRIVKKASTNDGHVLDVEPGDATPAQAPGWARMRRQSGFAWPTIYCNLSTWPNVIQAFKDQGEPMPLWWIARYNGVKEFPTLQGQEAIAKQYAGDVAPGYDLSWVKDFWPGVDGAQDMPLANPDFKYLFYDNPIQEFSTVSGLLANIKDNAKAAANLAGAINALRDLIIADDANDVTADAVAAKVKAAISADVADAVNDALAHVQVPAAEVDNEALSQALISELLARLAS
jgi:hypothetical protein